MYCCSAPADAADSAGAGAGVLAGGALEVGLLAADGGARVTVLVTVGLGFTVLTAAGTGFAVAVLETVGLGSGARTTVVVAVPHAGTAAATMATAPPAPAIGILMIALPRQPHHPHPYQLKPAIPANRRTIPELTPRKWPLPSSTRLRPAHPRPRPVPPASGSVTPRSLHSRETRGALWSLRSRRESTLGSVITKPFILAKDNYRISALIL